MGDCIKDMSDNISNEAIKGIDKYIRNYFDVSDVDIRTYSPLALAYIGDGVYDLVIRSIVVGRGNTKASKLHFRTSQIVKAASQARLIEAMEDELTEEEHYVYKRGRNAKSPTMAKNATMRDYREATGFEALVGYLYLQDKFERILEITKTGLARIELDI
ncbi:ribonuclease-3 family protein [Lachnospiraceae bacterium C7]|nr:ribonuclease-3 family protein [Lachnospiraceae bacterium C7]